MGKKRLRTYLALHLLLMLYSLTDLFGKMAAGYGFADIQFILLYGAVLVVLAIYAIGWQQVIKHLPLTTAFSNKAITVVWGVIWGVVFFQEELNLLKAAGVAVIIAGVVLFAHADGQAQLQGDGVQDVSTREADAQGVPTQEGSQRSPEGEARP